jgi:hypothetical protein
MSMHFFFNLTVVKSFCYIISILMIPESGTVIVPMFHMREVRHSKVKRPSCHSCRQSLGTVGT